MQLRRNCYQSPVSEQHEQEDEKVLDFERAPVDNPESVSADLSHDVTSGIQAIISTSQPENEKSNQPIQLFPDTEKIVIRQMGRTGRREATISQA
jgi:hypothetical protein